MGRRSIHTPDELRRVIVDAATEIVAQNGFLGLSAREIARKIDYSPGTLYNIFKNIDDLLLTIEVELLDKLIAHLKNVQQTNCARKNIHALADAYLSFSQDNQNLWNLLNQHHLPPGQQIPADMDTRHSKLEGIILAALHPDPGEDEDKGVMSGSVWAGIHGIISLAAAAKCSRVTFTTAADLVDDLIETYFAGLAAQRAPAGLAQQSALAREEPPVVRRS